MWSIRLTGGPLCVQFRDCDVGDDDVAGAVEGPHNLAGRLHLALPSVLRLSASSSQPHLFRVLLHPFYVGTLKVAHDSMRHSRLCAQQANGCMSFAECNLVF